MFSHTGILPNALNDDTSGCKCDWSELNSDELEEYLGRLFDVADTNCDGVLNEEEYEAMLMMSGLKFPDDVEIQAYPSSLTFSLSLSL